jgi:hypothetical protein
VGKLPTYRHRTPTPLADVFSHFSFLWKNPSNVMDPGDSAPQDWPNERVKILVPAWTLMIISSAFLVWRVVYGFMHGRKFMICDYLLIIATVGFVPLQIDRKI